MKRKWIGQNVTILGLSLSGVAAARYLSGKGANCTISEKKEASVDDMQLIQDLSSAGIYVETGDHKRETILNSDIIITSPGIPPHAEIIQFIKENKIRMMGEIELAYLEADKPFIAITGTNGKTTTTKLVSEILTNSGLYAPVCGNIGIPAVNYLDVPQLDYFVAEVSSFQIATSPVFKPQIAVFLNYTPDHIDWHGSKESYFKAKADLFTGHRSPVWSVLNACDPMVSQLADQTLSKVIFFGREMPSESVFIKESAIVYKNTASVTEIIKLSDIALRGEHNLQNIMAAIAIACILKIDPESVKKTISGFKPPEHRLEYVDTINGIDFYNDSKATNCDSAICALRAFEEKVVLIAGGKDKGTDLTQFAQEVKKRASAVILIGQATERFKEALYGFDNIKTASSLEEAIDVSLDLRLGTVLLSPACASFDMFKNFEERGQVFKDYVIKKKTYRENPV